MTIPAALEVTDLRVCFDYPRPAVAGISLHVDRGEIVALVGESGSGKTMTARAAIGLLPTGAQASGSVRVNGHEVLGLSEKSLTRIRGSEVAMVFQEPQTALNPVQTIGWQLRQALTRHQRLSRSAARDRAIQLLRLVEIPDPKTRYSYYPHQLSGGQKQRVVIALALAGDPALLLADEPTTALDVSVQREILDLLVRLRDRTDAGILLITHNLGVVAEIADRVVVVQLGETVESGAVDSIFAAPKDAYTRQLLDAVPRLDTAARDVTHPAPAAPDDPLVVDVQSVTVQHPGRFGSPPHTALSEVSVQVRPGQVHALVGESGSGKTSLGRAIGGLLPLAAGRILVAGDDFASLSGSALRTARRRISFVPQDPTASLDPRFCVEESIREPLEIQGIGDRRSRSVRVAELLSAVRLPTSFAQRLPHELSGGQRQRVALARALATDPLLLVADEPTSALDVSVQARVLELFAELQADLGFAAIFISHDLAVVRQVSDTVTVLKSGRVAETGPATRIFSQPATDYTRTLVESIPLPTPSRPRLGRPVPAQVGWVPAAP